MHLNGSCTLYGYKIQFRSRLPLFNGVFPSLVGPEQALVMEQEVDTLLRKDATEVVPPCDRIRVLEEVPKKDGGIASYSRSEIIEPLSHETQVQDDYYQASRVPNQVRGLVCDDRSERHLLPYIHSYSTPEVPKVCFQGQSIPISGSFVRPSTLTPHFHKVCGCSSGFVSSLEHPHTELHRRLFDSSSIRAVSSLASRWRSCSHERLGVKANAKKSVLPPVQRTTYLGVVWDSTPMQACLSPARIDSIPVTVKRVREGQSLTVKLFQSCWVWWQL